MNVSQPSFEDVVKEHGPMIRRIAASYEANPNLAEELVQDILLALWSALTSFRHEESVRTFVARIANNRGVSYVQRALRLPPSQEISEELPSEDNDPESEIIFREREARLPAAVRRLPLSLRQVVMLTLEGLSNAEIASVIGISANAVAIRMSRAKELLRQRLGVADE